MSEFVSEFLWWKTSLWPIFLLGKSVVAILTPQSRFYLTRPHLLARATLTDNLMGVSRKPLKSACECWMAGVTVQVSIGLSYFALQFVWFKSFNPRPCDQLRSTQKPPPWRLNCDQLCCDQLCRYCVNCDQLRSTAINSQTSTTKMRSTEINCGQLRSTQKPPPLKCDQLRSTVINCDQLKNLHH